ncbi:HAD family hydrolase [Paenarthrobacter aromaticivorans]|uniref:HAD family hydrolase n=1 Tax=Paenarthrobacter aromaticivorans TaxID=2849150 RepID=UPI003A813116
MSDICRAFGSWRPHGVIFDCDGLLMDTESLWIDTQRMVLESYGVSAERTSPELVGLPASVIGPRIAAHVGVESGAVLTQMLDTNLALVRESAVAMPGALRFVTEVSSRRPVGVASNSARPILDVSLHHGGFAGLFDVVVSADEVTRPKPAPDVYIAACTDLGLSPQDCLAFEDSEAGARAAVAAGMRVIAIPSPGQQPAGDVTFDSLEVGALSDWVQHWGCRT